MHGAIRTTGYPPVPERAFAESFKICIDNKEGRVARDAISCRREHRSSAMGHFTAGFDDKGAPAKRTGYMVTCAKDSDCRTRCPIHPLTGEHFFCQKQYALYDYASTDSNGNVAFHQLDEAHSGDPDYSEMQAAGDTGICVDYNYLFSQTCPIKPLSQAVGAVVGCGDTFISTFLCGLQVDRVGPDGSGVSITSGLGYNRTLVTATPDLDGDYINTPVRAALHVCFQAPLSVSPFFTQEMTCSDPLDCTNKYAEQLNLRPLVPFLPMPLARRVEDAREQFLCFVALRCRYLERTSRDGMGAPPACMLYADAPPSPTSHTTC